MKTRYIVAYVAALFLAYHLGGQKHRDLMSFINDEAELVRNVFFVKLYPSLKSNHVSAPKTGVEKYLHAVLTSGADLGAQPDTYIHQTGDWSPVNINDVPKEILAHRDEYMSGRFGRDFTKVLRFENVEVKQNNQRGTIIPVTNLKLENVQAFSFAYCATLYPESGCYKIYVDVDKAGKILGDPAFPDITKSSELPQVMPMKALLERHAELTDIMNRSKGGYGTHDGGLPFYSSRLGRFVYAIQGESGRLESSTWHKRYYYDAHSGQPLGTSLNYGLAIFESHGGIFSQSWFD